ncbi:hypothetical protein K438DRAFT_2023062 [Mycena galopus ATCC 62051]|nr:hypothetical protein K438DRAFT_2023062 [Mycena galopus ATCC 62051]
MNLPSRFPNELWMEVFAHLPPDTHRSLSSTQRALCTLARPLGFTEFKLYPYPYELQPPQAHIDDALARLNFYTSPRIAPYVRACTARLNHHRWQGSAQVDDEATPHVLMNAFFDRLLKFVALERFYTDRIRFTQIGMASLCALPRLARVEAFGCTVAPGEQIPPGSCTLRVSSLVTRYDYHMNDLWISLMSRDTLTELDLSDLSAVAKPNVAPFPSVRTLKMNDFPPTTHITLAILAAFPGVRTFASDYRGVLRNLTPAQAASVFPVLADYTGACENLHIFTQRPTLTRIALDAGFPFRNLVAELQGVHALPNITSLTARFATAADEPFGEAELGALFTLFPSLTELQLTLMPDAEEDGGFTPQAPSFLTMFALHPLLPHTLHSLSLEWDFPFEYGSTDSAQGNEPAAPDPRNLPEFPRLREALRGRCPRLRHIFLDGYHFLFVRWETPWVWEASARSYDEAEAIRARKVERIHGPPVLIS